MTLNRYAKKIDANQPAIVDALRKAGYSVALIGLPLDLLVGKNGINGILEVKIPGKKPDKDQQDFMDNWKGWTEWVSSIDEAFEALKRHGM